jgi:anti-sigma B factor antagonist
MLPRETDAPVDPLEAREKELMGDLLAGPEEDSGAPLRVRITRRGEVPILHVEGELDLYTAQPFQQELDGALAGSPPALVIDLTRVPYIDSSGFVVILRATKRVPGPIAVVTPRDRILRLFQATGLNHALSLYRTLPEALRELDGAAAPPGS